jgi:molybdate transport system substrate-binding protein
VRTRLVSSIALVGLVMAACTNDAATPALTPPPVTPAAAAPGSAASANLTIYAAASLKAALAKVKTTYEATHPGTTLTISTDSSAALETKIEQGAPADVFLSADTANPQKLVDKGLAAGGITRFAGNL